MNLGSLGNNVLLSLDDSQRKLSTTVAQLSSGLRINTAADDPSGLAISTSLQTQASGLDAGTQSVQTAANALTVADGAMSSMDSILQRMRSLVVEGRSDLISDSDRGDLNSELSALGHEIDSISTKTNFNGYNLLDGTASPIATTNYGAPLVAQNDTIATGLPLVQPDSLSTSSPTLPPTDIAITVSGVDPATGDLIVNVSLGSTDPTVYTVDASNNPLPNPPPIEIAPGTNYPASLQPLVTLGILQPNQIDQQQVNGPNGAVYLQFTLNNLSLADVGKTAFVYSGNTTTTSQPLQVGVGDNEGDTVSVNLPTVSTYQLNVQGIQLSDNDTTNEGSEYRIDAALQTVVGARATIGAQMTALQETQTNSTTASTELTASASAIRDLNVGAATTAYTAEQIQVELGTKILASVQSQATAIYTLLSDSIAS